LAPSSANRQNQSDLYKLAEKVGIHQPSPLATYQPPPRDPKYAEPDGLLSTWDVAAVKRWSDNWAACNPRSNFDAREFASFGLDGNVLAEFDKDDLALVGLTHPIYIKKFLGNIRTLVEADKAQARFDEQAQTIERLREEVEVEKAKAKVNVMPPQVVHVMQQSPVQGVQSSPAPVTGYVPSPLAASAAPAAVPAPAPAPAPTFPKEATGGLAKFAASTGGEWQ